MSDVTILPDGSAFATVSMPLPKDHWLTNDGGNVPPMPMRVGKGAARSALADMVRTAAKYAIRASTMNGKDSDFDPDAMVQNMVVGLLGYWTEDGTSGDSWGMPSPVPPLFSEAADEIERLTDDYAAATHLLADRDAQIERLTKERDAANAELTLRRKSESASERLHNICEGISRDADGSEWSREEWEKLDADMLALRKELAAANAVIDKLIAALQYHQEQTRPIHSTQIALDAARALRKGAT